MAFSEEIKIKAMVACGRCCCICHKFCGNNMEVHHIKARSDGGQDTYDNAIPLCFDCHAEVRQYDPRHPNGTKFTEKELHNHRDNWYDKVKQGIDKEKNKNEKVEPVRIYHQKDYQKIMLHKIDEGRQMISYIDGICGFSYDEETQTLEDVKLVAEFVQYIKEIIDFDDLIADPYDRIMAGFNLTQSIKELDEAGFWVFVGRENQKIVGGLGNPTAFPVLIMRIVRKDNKQIVRVDK